MLFVGTEIREARGEFTEAYDSSPLSTQMSGFENAQPFAHDARRAPTELTNEDSKAFL